MRTYNSVFTLINYSQKINENILIYYKTPSTNSFFFFLPKHEILLTNRKKRGFIKKPCWPNREKENPYLQEEREQGIPILSIKIHC